MKNIAKKIRKNNHQNTKHCKNNRFYYRYNIRFVKRLRCNKKLYYITIEKDLWDYSDWQTGSPREAEKNSDDWKNKEKDIYGLYKGDDKYIDYLKRVWKNEKEES